MPSAWKINLSAALPEVMSWSCRPSQMMLRAPEETQEVESPADAPVKQGKLLLCLGNRDDLGTKCSHFEKTARLRSFHETISNDFLKQF